MNRPESTQTVESVPEALRFLWRWMPARRRREFYLSLGMMLVGALAELIAIGSVLPFLTVMADPLAAAKLAGLPVLGGWADADNPRPLIVAAVILVIGAAFLTAGIRLLLILVNLRFIRRFSHELGMAVFERVLRQPYSYYVTRNTSEVLGGLEKVQRVIWMVVMPAMQAAVAAVLSLAIVVLLFVIDPFAASVGAVTMGLCYLAVSLFVAPRLRRNSRLLAHAATERIKTVQEGLGGIRDVLLEQSQDVFEDKFRKIDLSYQRSHVINYFIGVMPRFVIEAIGIALLVALAVVLSRGPAGLGSAIPALGAIALGAQRLLPLMQQAYLGWSGFTGNRAMLIDVVALMRTPIVTSTPRDRRAPVTPFRDAIELRRASFHYVNREPVLHDIDLRIERGARIGFIGETGSGKSTMLDLLMGLLEPSEGAILIDAEPLGDGNRANWQAQIAHVPQTIFLSDSSIASNIAFGETPDRIDLERVRSSARQAHIARFIEGLEDGYGTLVGERGVRLSGGQRQRIGIARALYKQAPVLILDEATSALDDETEAAVMASLSSLDVTVLIVAHRTSTLAGCDQVVRMADGRIVEKGSYREMVKQSGQAQKV